MFYYVKNLQGDIVKILDEDGNEKASYVYNAWGNILSQSEDELSSINPLRYRGYVYDEDTTLYYLQTRYYPQLPVDLSMLMILRILVLPVQF